MTLLIGVMAILLADSPPVFTLQQLVVIGTLFAFMFVAAGVIETAGAGCRTSPTASASRSRRSCLALSLVATLWLMVNLQVLTWVWFALWMAFGLLVYLVYGRRHSLVAPPELPPLETTPEDAIGVKARVVCHDPLSFL